MKSIPTMMVALLFTPLAIAESVDETLTWSQGSTITISVPRGDIEISGNQSQQVNVVGRLDSEAEAFIFEQQGDELRIEVKLPRNWGDQQDNNKHHSALKISLPANAKTEINLVSTDLDINNVNNVNVDSVSGDIRANTSNAEFEVDTVSGDISTININGELDVDTVSGDVVAKQCSGEISLKTVSGDVNANDLMGKLGLESVSGDLNISASKLSSVQGHSVSGDIDIEARSLAIPSQIELETVSGDIRIDIDLLEQVQVQAHTGGGGSISNSWSSDRPIKSKYGGSQKLSFGSGSQQVELNTVSGNLSLRK